MLLTVEDGAERRERVRRLLDQAVLRGAQFHGSRRRPVFVEAFLGAPGAGPVRRRALRHAEALALQLRSLLGDDDALDELADLGLATVAAVNTLRVAASRQGHERDAGFSGARVARCAAEALRAHATLVALPAGAAVPDVPPTVLWLIADLSARLRATGREGRLGRPWDAGVEARDAADLVVTTYRRWRPRMRGAPTEQVAQLAVAAAQIAVWCGFASIGLDEDDGCERPVTPVVTPPGRSMTAAAEPPAPTPAMVFADAATACRGALQPVTGR
jgi:hypothetical protein